MKVSYETDIDRGEPVAYVEVDGNLIYDAWFRGKVEEALKSTKPSSPHGDVMQCLRASIDRGEPVAYLEEDGTLVFKDVVDGKLVFVTSDGECGTCIDLNPECIAKAFYKGDTITITF